MGHIETIGQTPPHLHDVEVTESVEITIADLQEIGVQDLQEVQQGSQDLLPEHLHGTTQGDHIESLLLIDHLERGEMGERIDVLDILHPKRSPIRCLAQDEKHRGV